MNSLKPKFFYQLAVSLLYSAAPIIVFPYVSRVLGPENIGKINFVDYASQFFILLASFGIPFYGAREIAKARDQKQKLSQLISELVGVHVVITLISLLLFGLLIIFKHNEFSEKTLIILAMINLAASAFGVEWVIQGMENFKFLATRSFIIKILSLVAIFILVKQSTDFRVYYGILIGSNLLLLLIDGNFILKNKFHFRKSLDLKKHLQPLSLFFLTTVTLSIYNFFDTVILGLLTGTIAVGFYTTSLKVIRLSHNFINDIGGVLLPRISHLVESKDQTEITRLLNKSLQYVLTLTLPLFFFILFSSKEIILVLGGKKFYESIAVLKILSFLPIIIGLGNIFFIQILLPFGKEKIIFIGVLSGALISIVSNFILCPLYAEKGAAFSCLIAEGSVTLFLGLHACKKVSLQVDLKLCMGMIISGLLFIPIILFTQKILNSNLLILLAAGTFCICSYLLTQLYLFKNSLIKEIIEFLKHPKSGIE